MVFQAEAEECDIVVPTDIQKTHRHRREKSRVNESTRLDQSSASNQVTAPLCNGIKMSAIGKNDLACFSLICEKWTLR